MLGHAVPSAQCVAIVALEAPNAVHSGPQKSKGLGLALQISGQKAADRPVYQPHHFADRKPSTEGGGVVYPGDLQRMSLPSLPLELSAPASKLGTAGASTVMFFYSQGAMF